MKKCSSCGREIKPSGENILEIIINNKKRIYCSECQQKSEVQAELKAAKGKITKLLLIPLGVVVVLALVIGGVIWWWSYYYTFKAKTQQNNLLYTNTYQH